MDLKTKRLFQIDIKNALATGLDQSRAVYKINRLQPGTVEPQEAAKAAKAAKQAPAKPAKVKLTKNKDKVTVSVDGKLFTEYIPRDQISPALYPVIGPNQEPNLSLPLSKKILQEKAPITLGIPGIYFTFGKVNNIDFLEHRTGKDKFIKNVDLQTDGNKIFAHNQWLHNDKKVLGDITEITFYADTKTRYIDYKVTLIADTKDLVFGDTKEGMMAIRMDPSFRVKDRNAKLINDSGRNGKSVWGKEAKWVSYSNKSSSVITMMDHPSNLRQRSKQHARDYGLCAANPFGSIPYSNKKEPKVPFTLKKGKQITFQYRFVFHSDKALESKQKIIQFWTQK